MKNTYTYKGNRYKIIFRKNTCRVGSSQYMYHIYDELDRCVKYEHVKKSLTKKQIKNILEDFENAKRNRFRTNNFISCSSISNNLHCKNI